MEGFVSPSNDLSWTQEENDPITGRMISSVSLSSKDAVEAQLLADTINAAVNRGNAPSNYIIEEPSSKDTINAAVNRGNTPSNDTIEKPSNNLIKNNRRGGGGAGIIALINYLNEVYPDNKIDKISDSISHLERISTDNHSSPSPPNVPLRTSSIKIITSTSSSFLPIRPLPSSRPLTEVTSLPFSKVIPILSSTQTSKEITPPSMTLKVTVTPIKSLTDDVSSVPSISTFSTTSNHFIKDDFDQTESTLNSSANTSNYCLVGDHGDTDIENSKDTSANLKSCLKSGRKSGKVFVKSRSESPSKRSVNFKAYDTVNYFITPDEVLETDFPYEIIDNEDRTGVIQCDHSLEETFSIVNFSNKNYNTADTDSPYEIVDFHKVEDGGRKGVIVSLKPIDSDKQNEASVNTADMFPQPTDKIMFPTCQTKDSIEASVTKERGRQKYQDRQQLKSKKKRTQSLNPFTRKQDQEKLSNFDIQTVSPKTSDISCEAYTQTVHKTDGCSVM